MSWTLFWLLVKAAQLTILISLASVFIGFLLGVLVCAAQLSGRRGLMLGARCFISFFRGTPLLVQLMLIYYLLPVIHINVPSIVAAIIGMSLSTAAYQAEILRGGFISVPKGLLEAADMCGMRRRDIFRRIRAPIAVRLTLPSLTNEAIMLLKASSLVSVVGVIELTRKAQDLAASTFEPLPLYACAGLIYIVINGVLAYGSARAERRFNWGRI